MCLPNPLLRGGEKAIVPNSLARKGKIASLYPLLKGGRKLILPALL